MTHSELPRLGIVGAGPWARDVHLPAAIASRDVELASVWTRDPAKSAALAEAAGVDAAPTFEDLLERVDIVAFAVPPTVQGELALRAAQAGKQASDIDVGGGLNAIQLMTGLGGGAQPSGGGGS